MNETAKLVYAKLDALGIPYDAITHEAVRTIEDCAAGDARLGAVTAKNYFLTTKNQKNFYLCLVRPDARFRTSDISRQAGSSRLSFGTEEQMQALLRVHPGAVSPMGLIFDTEDRVRLLVDEALLRVNRIAFHPCDNTQTLAMSAADFFHGFLPAVGHIPQLISVHDFL